MKMNPKTSPILAKFAMESDFIVPLEYFSALKVKLSQLTNFLEENSRGESLECIGLDLLYHEGEPSQIRYFLGESRYEFSLEWNFINRKCVKNNNLSLVSTRQNLGKVFYGRNKPKLEFYEFFPPPENFQYELKAPDMSEYVFVFKIYKPFLETRRDYIAKQVKIMQEIHILSTNKLSQLQKLIQCNINFCGLQDVSNQIGKGWKHSFSDNRCLVYPSSFFFINNTFYEDQCSTNNAVSLSQNWLLKNNIQTSVKNNLSVDMKDLGMQIGRPYLFSHLGECEHVIILSDIHLMSNLDLKERSGYPRVTAVSAARTKQCMLCGSNYARWFIKNCLKLTIARAYLCHRCLLSFCYTDGRKNCEFELFQYIDHTVW